MDFHGGGSAAAVVATGTAELERVKPDALGYTNLFGAVDPDSQNKAAFQGYGSSGSQYGRTADLLRKLAKRMEQPYWQTPAAGADKPDDNPNIPAGYTYLAQFVAHDLTFVASIFPTTQAPPANQRNLRAIALDLETVYGGGPFERPLCYAREPGGVAPHKLRLGLISDATQRPPVANERKALARDLPRTACPMTSESNGAADAGLTETLISDPRNDDHPLVAQTAVLFHLLHNAVCETLGSKTIWQENHEHPLDERVLFADARRLVTHVYQGIVRHDLMRRLLCPSVHRHYTTLPDPLLDNNADARMPVEFSHAAFRMGHAMVRPGYMIRDDFSNLEDMLRTTSSRLPQSMPPAWQWIVKWSRFYELDGTPRNLSRRLAPSFVRTLFVSPLLNDMRNRSHATGAAPTEVGQGLPGSDLARGSTVHTRSVESLIEKIANVAPDLIRGSRLLSDRKYRHDKIADWLRAGPPAAPADRFSDDDIQTLATDPPLLFFVLFEAAVEQEGLRLGVLGSVIVAEVIFRALMSHEHAQPKRMPGVASLADQVFGNEIPSDMPALIRFLERRHGLQHVQPLFV